MTRATKKLYLSTLIKKKREVIKLLDETTRVFVDDDIRLHGKGLFGKTMSYDTFHSIWFGPESDRTLLQHAQHMFLEDGTVDVSKLAKIASYSVLDLYRIQTGELFDLSLKITDSTFRRAQEEIWKTRIPKALLNWVDEKGFHQMLQLALTRTKTKLESGNGIPDYIADSMETLSQLLLANVNNIHIHVGHAGCGKSTHVANILNERARANYFFLDGVVVSLSNTIGLMFKQKVPMIEHVSCTGVRCEMNFPYATKKASGKRIVVIDEFSQWGFEQVDVLLYLLKENPRAEFYIMGDTAQIPTFLGGGSLLYSVMNLLPSQVVEHKIQYRYRNNPLLEELMATVSKGVWNGELYSKYIASFPEPELRDMDVVVTGANDNVTMMNLQMLIEKFPSLVPAGTLEELSTLSLSLLLLEQSTEPVELICSTTGKLEDVKIYRNERFYMSGKRPDPTCKFILKSRIDGREVTVNGQDLDTYFELGYAITVNRAQGLEWDNVLVVVNDATSTGPLKRKDRNLQTANAMYVAISRARSKLWLYVRTSGDTDSRIQQWFDTSYRMVDNFAEL